MWPGASRLNAISPADCASSSSSGMPPNTRRLRPFLSGCRPICMRRVLPQQHVVLEVDRHLPVERHVQHGHELALEAIVARPGAVPSVI